MRHRIWCLLPVVVNLFAQATRPDTDEDPRYFPAGVFARGKWDNALAAQWYRGQLRALDEPALFNNPSLTAEVVYRFTWLRTFHHPIALRVVIHADGTGTLTAKMADGAGGYKPGKLTLNRTREISQAEVQRLSSLVQAMDFWHMPTEPPFDKGAGCFGAEWILEGLRGAEYHVVDRWSPEKGPLHKLGLYLVQDLGRIGIPPEAIY